MSGMSPLLLISPILRRLQPPSLYFIPSAILSWFDIVFTQHPRPSCRESRADLTGKVAEGKQYQKAQGKYSLEGALLLKTHAAQQKLKEKEKGVDPLAG